MYFQIIKCDVFFEDWSLKFYVDEREGIFSRRTPVRDLHVISKILHIKI
jgi:hypothetical protein